MKMKMLFVIILVLCSVSMNVTGQNKDKAIFRERKPGFYQDSILREDLEIKARSAHLEVRKNFVVDLTSVSLPDKFDLYKNQQWHNPPVSQGNTGTCWCFSTTSFLGGRRQDQKPMPQRVSGKNMAWSLLMPIQAF